MEFDTLQQELQQILCVEYARAFSERDVAALERIYRPNSVVTFHQLGEDKSGRAGKGKDIAIYTGHPLGAILRLRIPLAVAAKAMFRRLARQGYDHSIVKLLAIEDVTAEGTPRARANCIFERFRADGELYETGYGLYLLEKLDGAWRIAEIWTYDDIDAPPPSLQIERLKGVQHTLQLYGGTPNSTKLRRDGPIR